jgi:hypothetical protein
MRKTKRRTKRKASKGNGSTKWRMPKGYVLISKSAVKKMGNVMKMLHQATALSTEAYKIGVKDNNKLARLC